MKLPEEFEGRMKALLGGEFSQFADALNEKSVRGFRVNTEKISLDRFEKINGFGREKIPYAENGFYLDFDKVGLHPYHHAGMIYVQEPAAMAPAECVEIEKDWKILDLCAAPGGKSSQLHNKLGPDGVLVSNEIIPSRCRVLTGNIERLGLKNTVTTCLDTSAVCAAFPRTFDLVMVDAPCSGEGMFRKDGEAANQWSVQNVLMCAERQKKILDNAACAVRESGYIVYSTCTFSLEENEMVVDSFLSDHPEFELVPVTKRVEKSSCGGIFFDGCKCKNIEYARRFYPHKNRGEGQFAAVFKSRAEKVPRIPSTRKRSKPDKAVLDFLDETLVRYKAENVLLYKDRPVYFTPDFFVPDGLAFTCGVTIGEKGKNYIRPHHQFFMAMGSDFKRKTDLALGSDEIRKYIAGEEFKTDCENGWAAVTVENCTLGGVKIVGANAKNHYPKGLRGSVAAGV